MSAVQQLPMCLNKSDERRRSSETQAELVQVADVDEHRLRQHIAADKALDMLTLKGRLDGRGLEGNVVRQDEDVKDGTSDPEEAGDKVLRRFHLQDLLHEKWNIPELPVSLSNGVHLGIINASHLVAVDKNELTLVQTEQALTILLIRLQFSI